VARSNGTPSTGHNSGQLLTDEEFDDLKSYYARTIRAQQRVHDQKKAEADGERDKVTSLFKRMAADLKTTRQDFQTYLTDLSRPRSEFKSREKARQRLYANSGLDTQFELDLAPDTVTDQAEAEAEGRRAYMAYEDPIPPAHIAAILHPDWMRGWHDEMSKTAMKMGRAEAIIARRSEPDPEAEAVDLNDEEEVGTDLQGEAGDAGEPGEGEDADAGDTGADEQPGPPDPDEVKRQAEALEANGFTAGARRQRGSRKAA
jgi:hypothetical protein